MTVLRQLSDFFPFVKPYAPAALDPSVEQALRLAAAEFCERTRAWRHSVEITTKADCATIAAPDYASIFEIESATFDKRRLEPMQFMDIDPAASTTGQPSFITQVNADTVLVVPFQSGVLNLVLYLKPRIGTDYTSRSPYETQTGNHFNQVPEFIFEHHAEAIGAGALSRILMLPDQSYTDPKLAMQHRAAFESTMNTFFRRNIRGQHRARARTKPQYF